MMEAQTKETLNEMIEWGHAYKQAWSELTKGAYDIESTLDYAYEIWPTMKKCNPAIVAKVEFDGLRDDVRASIPLPS